MVLTEPQAQSAADPVPGPQPRDLRRRTGNASTMIRRIAVGAVVPILILVGWDVVVRLEIFPKALIPSPSTVLSTLNDWATGSQGGMFYSGQLPGDVAATLERVAIGYLSAAVIGVLLGLLIGVSRWADELLTPTMRILGPVPPTTWIPVCIVVLGIGAVTNYFLVFLGAVFPIAASSTVAVSGVARDLVRAARMMGRGRLGTTFAVVLPAALPGIVGGLRIGLGLAWMMAVTSEMLAVRSGLGYTIWNCYNYLDYPGVFAAMIVLGICGLATDMLLRAITASALRWHTATGVRA
ncbi:ABC transporter permease [Gordonia hankookensis]|uniref:ABC transporter permease n=1 Tax=Gordonia hankookensis TaxID=589403 RepID=A0ABR7WDA5_9ACTN|nr:ABC transporter permease [Gordonia hankookensis]MBD1320625.1 ABC transporter permease [Gordonia hankookensis]